MVLDMLPEACKLWKSFSFVDFLMVKKIQPQYIFDRLGLFIILEEPLNSIVLCLLIMHFS